MSDIDDVTMIAMRVACRLGMVDTKSGRLTPSGQRYVRRKQLEDAFFGAGLRRDECREMRMLQEAVE